MLQACCSDELLSIDWPCQTGDTGLRSIRLVSQLGGSVMTTDDNPFASPTADLAAPVHASVSGSDAEFIRRKYLKHEASVQSVGYLYYFAAFVTGIASVGIALNVINEGGWLPLAMLVTYLALTAGLIYVGKGLRNLQPSVKLPVGILSGVGLIGLPIGTIINGYILYLVFSEKGKIVFSPGYREVIEQTPHIKYKTSILVSILIALLVAVVIVGLIAFLMPN